MKDRQTSDRSGRDPALDGLRGIAVLMVFVFHYGGGLKSPHAAVRLLGYLSETGWIGVTLFFALSGFLITGGLWDSLGTGHWLRNFYARRALRILPLYYLALALSVAISIADGARFSEVQSILYDVPFLQNLPIVNGLANQGWITLPLYHLWSLAVEEQFYLLWPMLLLLAAHRHNARGPNARRRALHLCLGVFLVSALFRIAIWGLPFFRAAVENRYFDNFLLTHAGPLALGAAVALALRDRPGLEDRKVYEAQRGTEPTHPTEGETVHRWSTPAFFAGTLIYLLTSWYCRSFYLTPRPQFAIGLLGVTVAVAALIPIAMHSGLPRTIFSIAPLRWLGRISYGFYVFHVLLAPAYDLLGARLTHASSGTLYQGVRFVVAFIVTTLVAWLSFHWIEQPILASKGRYPMPSPLPPSPLPHASGPRK